MSGPSRIQYQDTRVNPNKARHDAESGNIDAQLYMGIQSLNSENNSPIDNLNAADFEYTEAYYWLEKAAKQGNLEAMSHLVYLYEEGLGGVKQNIEEACEWMDKYLDYSDSGNTLFEYLSERDPELIKRYMQYYGLYLVGTPCPTPPNQSLPSKKTDMKKACELLEKAANMFNCMDSIKFLYKLYTNPDRLVEMDIDKGMYWMLRGAQNGDGISALELAFVFAKGIVPVNYQLQTKFLQIAEKLGYPEEAKESLDLLTFRMNRDEASKFLRDVESEKKIEFLLKIDESSVCSNPNCDQEEVDKPFMACSKCCSVKYCGRSCQVYHWRNGHKKDCKQMCKRKEYVKQACRNEATIDARVCFNFKCQKLEEENGIKFQTCSRCKAAIYCSLECQKIHFRNGHKEVCKKTMMYFVEADKLLDALNNGEFQKPDSMFND